MTSHSSATVREETPHVNRTSRTNAMMDVLVRRARAVLNDKSIDAQTRATIRHALEVNDPWLARLVRRTDAGESSVDAPNRSQTLDANEDASAEKRSKHWQK